MKEQVFYGIEAYMARKKVEVYFLSEATLVTITSWPKYRIDEFRIHPKHQVLEGGDIGQLEILAKDPDYFNPDPFQVWPICASVRCLLPH